MAMSSIRTRTSDKYKGQRYPITQRRSTERAFRDNNQLMLIEDHLSHGSGINYDWYIEDKGSYYGAYNAYDVMNEHGFYIGKADFQLIIPKRNPMRFKLHFQGNRAQYLNQYYMLRDYLEDTFADDIREMKRLGVL